jgi:uncharacterized membrane protein YgcG
VRRIGLALALGLAPLASACGYAPTGPAQQAAAAATAPFALTGRVVDRAGLLQAADRQTLEQRLEALEQRSGPQLVIVTVPDLKGMTIEQLGLALGNGWGIGDRKRNDGVLMIVAPNQHQTRIEVGKGLETTLTDPLCAEIIAHDMIPQFREGYYKAGIDAGVDRLIAALSTRPART